MLSIAEGLAAAGGEAPAPDRAALWDSLQQIAGAAAQGMELWEGGADPAAAADGDATVRTASGRSYVSSYERAVVTGSDGYDFVAAHNDAKSPPAPATTASTPAPAWCFRAATATMFLAACTMPWSRVALETTE